MDVSLDGSHDSDSLLLSGGSGSGQLGAEDLHGLVHTGGGGKDVGQEEPSFLEEFSDLGHSLAEGVDDVGGTHAGSVSFVDSVDDSRELHSDHGVNQCFLLVFKSHFFHSFSLAGSQLTDSRRFLSNLKLILSYI